ncbi:MAG: dolichol-P-glucose synthetase [Verrucomicrobia bacterium]|nr:MAG: dolichol-P-glucose synthetase [Verrucomicrobiota bacterium]
MSLKRQTEAIEVSVVIPCLNEEDTLARCIEKARQACREHSIAGEIVVADNGSTDLSRAIAERHGARVVMIKEPGYGSALMGGIAAASGQFVLIGDADDSYDFLELPKIVEKLREGFDLVQGCRLPAGGGSIRPGAMPFLHRWIGNPFFSLLVRKWFGAPINDVYCGLRGFTKAMYERLDQRCTGMEFATEMIIKASLRGEKIAEVPITLYPDKRTSHAPHLKTFRDGWRTFRYFLMCSPRWLFLVPGGVFIAFGLLGYLVAMPGLRIGHSTFDAHTLLFASLSILCGYQCILFAIFAKTFATTEGFLPPDRHLERFFEVVNLEKGLVVAALAVLAGGSLLLVAVWQWWLTGFGHLDYARTMRFVVPGATLVALGFQTVFSSFFVSLLGMRRK